VRDACGGLLPRVLDAAGWRVLDAVADSLSLERVDGGSPSPCVAEDSRVRDGAGDSQPREHAAWDCCERDADGG